MHNISQMQLIKLWIDLEDCLNQCNGYAGDTAEIYVHTIMSHSPACFESEAAGHKSELLAELAKEFYANAAKSLYSVFRLFEQKRNCLICVGNYENGSHSFDELDVWFLDILWTYRLHVKVVKNERV